MTTRRWKRHSVEEVAAKLRDADRSLNAGQDPTSEQCFLSLRQGYVPSADLHI